MTPTPFRRLMRLSTVVAAAFWLAAPVHAANDAGDARALYEKQKAACVAGKSTEDRATCLKEAGAAYDEARRGNLGNADADFRKNEMARCKALAGDEQRDCLARMKGGGTVSGSVGGGGILREKTTREVVRPAAVIPAAAPPASAGG